ncbi:MAG: hypothetical protein M1832_002820 [Thelocarpon impressellum]|nr:MAG: hypothetical protein M1832_002820 [Thelocarpon impressellum]
MLAQRTVQQAMRRLAARPQSLSRPALSRLGLPATLPPLSQPQQSRPVATQKIPPSAGLDILAAQRRHRPVSPHLTIYRPQITWYLSALNRITGSALSGGLYVFATAYLAAPLLGWHLDSAALAAAFGSLPVAAKVATKFLVALPFTFHSFNGVRHLVWDTGREFGNAQVVRTGWMVVGATVVGSGILAFV